MCFLLAGAAAAVGDHHHHPPPPFYHNWMAFIFRHAVSNCSSGYQIQKHKTFPLFRNLKINSEVRIWIKWECNSLKFNITTTISTEYVPTSSSTYLLYTTASHQRPTESRPRPQVYENINPRTHFICVSRWVRISVLFFAATSSSSSSVPLIINPQRHTMLLVARNFFHKYANARARSS